jgi:hypothetical protein
MMMVAECGWALDSSKPGIFVNLKKKLFFSNQLDAKDAGQLM